MKQSQVLISFQGSCKDDALTGNWTSGPEKVSFTICLTLMHANCNFKLNKMYVTNYKVKIKYNLKVYMMT